MTGNDNTAVGLNALFSNTTANNNTAVGRAAYGANTTGNNNTAIGWSALAPNTAGTDNTAVGFYALQGGLEASASRNTAAGSACARQHLVWLRQHGDWLWCATKRKLRWEHCVGVGALAASYRSYGDTCGLGCIG